MPNDKIRALVTSVDRFTVYTPKPIAQNNQEDQAFYVLGERIEIKHLHSSKIEKPDKMQHSVQIFPTADSSERRHMRRRADSDPEALSSPRLTAKPIRKREFKIARSQDTELSESESRDKLDGSTSDESSESTYFIKKQFEHANWNIFQKRVFFQSFAQKPHDFPVFLTKHAAIKEMNKYTVQPEKNDNSVRIGAPIFKVMTSETELSGQKAYTIHHIAKIYFYDQSCRVYADMGQINLADKHHTEANDFLFTVSNIKDNIPPLVKISQDLEMPLLLLALTFITQVIQIIITNYLPNNDSDSC